MLINVKQAIVITGLLSYLMANPLYAADKDYLLTDYIITQIKFDVSLSDTELNAYKDDFQSYYQSEVLPRISNLDQHLTMHPIEISPYTYLMTTAGIAPSDWGGKELLYLITTSNESPKIVLSHELNPQPKWGPDGYKLAEFWTHPNNGCGYNDFVHAVFQYAQTGGSGSTFRQVYVNYNRYEDQYELSINSSPVRFSLTPCKDD